MKKRKTKAKEHPKTITEVLNDYKAWWKKEIERRETEVKSQEECLYTVPPKPETVEKENVSLKEYDTTLPSGTITEKQKDILKDKPRPPVVSNPHPQGWICPRCGAVMSPFQINCLYCRPQTHPYPLYPPYPPYPPYRVPTVWC